MKKYLIILLLFFLSVVLGFLIKQKQQPPGEPGLGGVSNLPIEKRSDLISYNIDAKVAYKPTIKECVAGSPVNNKQSYVSFANNLGFNGPTSYIEGSKGVYYSWSDGGRELIIGGSPVVLVLNFGSSKNYLNSGESPDSMAETILKDVVGRVLDYEIKQRGVFYYKSVEGEAKRVAQSENYDYTEHVYDIAKDGLPILTHPSTAPSVSIQITSKPSPVSVSFSIIPRCDLGKEQKTIDPDISVDLLFDNKGLLSWVESINPGGELTYVGSVPTSHVIKKSYLGYYFNHKLNSFAPVVVFEGVGKIGETDYRSISLVGAI